MSVDPDETQSQPLAHLLSHRQSDTHGAAQLVVLTGEMSGRRVILDGDVSLGRDAHASISFQGVETVSRRHARIERRPDGSWQIEDLGSSNGTSINGKLVAKATLRFGDKIRLGASTVLMFGRNDPLEDQLFEAQRFQLLGKLAAGIAHDFNNVLGSVITNAGYVADPERLGPGELEQCVNDILEAGRQGAALASQLLAFASPSPREERAAAVDRAADEIVHILRRTLRRTVTLRSEVPAGLFVACAPSALAQVLMHLCVNAVDAVTEGGTVWIEAATYQRGVPGPLTHATPIPGPHVVVSVRDDGIGMDARTKQRVFEPFFTTKPRGKGTGLGLATVAKIVLEHHGSVFVESEPGRGARFEIHLPAAELEPPAVVAARPADPGRPLRGIVLVVDDNELIRVALKRALTRAGMRVLTASGGEEALVVFAGEARLDLVILDLDMPELDGEATLQRMRRLDASPRILIASGGIEPRDEARLRAAGVDGFLHKPFDMAALLAVLDGLPTTDRPPP